MLKITLTSGLVGKKTTQIKIVEALGLGKFGSSAVHSDSPTIRGMLNKVHHLVSILPAEEHEIKAAKEKREAKAAARQPNAADRK